MVASYKPASWGSGYSPAHGAGIEPLMFAPGIAIAIAGTVMLIKAVKNYLK